MVGRDEGSDERGRMGLRGSSIVRRDLATQVWAMQFGIRVGRVAIARPSRAEHHVATINRTFVHLSQMDCGKVDLESSLVAESLETDIALHTFLSSRRIDELSAKGPQRIPTPITSTGCLVPTSAI